MLRPPIRAVLSALFVLLPAAPSGALLGQEGLDAAARSIRAAWLDGDMRGVVAGSRAIRLEIPLEGVRPGGTLTAGHAAKLLGEYLAPAAEVSFELREVRSIGAGRGYVEAVRTYVVRGTGDALREVVFLGLEQTDGDWWVVEVRIAP